MNARAAILLRASILGLWLCAGCGGGSSSSPTAPSSPSSSTPPTAPTSPPPAAPTITTAQATATADNVGVLTLSAIQSGSAQVGILRVSRQAFDRLAAAGATFGTASCPGGGQVMVAYVRDYTPAGGEIDLSALKATFQSCAFSSGGATFQISGDLTLSGRYYGSARTPEMTVSGSLTTSGGTCSLSGNVSATGSFSGSACGTTVTTSPPAPPPSAPTLTGRWVGLVSAGDGARNTIFCDERWDWQFDLTQSGNDVTGTFAQTQVLRCPGDPDGSASGIPLAGTVSGATFSFVITASANNRLTCNATFTATRMTGSCAHPTSGTATFAVNKP